jgi:hypothetical protein
MCEGAMSGGRRFQLPNDHVALAFRREVFIACDDCGLLESSGSG